MIVRGARDIHANRHVHGQRCDVHTARDVPMVNVGVGCPDDLQTGGVVPTVMAGINSSVMYT